jgi:hypothetical protein
MEEYKIIRGTDADCQKWLNQWKHEYKITIYSMQVVDSREVVILLTQTR